MQALCTLSIEWFQLGDDILRIHQHCMTITTTYNCVKGFNFALLLDISFNFLRALGALCVFGAFGAQAQSATLA